MGPAIWSEEGINDNEKDKLCEIGFEFGDTERPTGNVKTILAQLSASINLKLLKIP